MYVDEEGSFLVGPNARPKREKYVRAAYKENWKPRISTSTEFTVAYVVTTKKTTDISEQYYKEYVQRSSVYMINAVDVGHGHGGFVSLNRRDSEAPHFVEAFEYVRSGSKAR